MVMAKTKMDPTLKVVIIVIVALTALPILVVIIGIVFVLLSSPAKYRTNSNNNTTNNTNSSTIDNSAANLAITQKAIEQKDPSLCSQISGSTTETYPLPPINGKPQTGSSTFNQSEYQQRCIAQAKAGQPYVY